MGSVRATIAGRFTLALAIGALILAPGMANAQLAKVGSAGTFSGAPTVATPIHEQYDDCVGGGPASQQFPDFADAVLQAADDFPVAVNVALNQVIALGLFDNPAAANLNSITVEVYDNDGPGDLPGTLLCSQEDLPNAGGPADATLDVALDGSCTLGSGTYWMSVLPVMDFGGGTPGQWFWNSNSSGFGSEFAWQDPVPLIPDDPCTSWQLGISTCGIGADFQNLCMGIGADEVADGGTGTPAVGTTGAIVTLLVVMAISFFYLRRRQTA